MLLLQSSKHKDKYTEFVRQQRATRLGKSAVDSEEKHSTSWDDNVNLGMNPKASLDEPELVAPAANEVCWVCVYDRCKPMRI